MLQIWLLKVHQATAMTVRLLVHLVTHRDRDDAGAAHAASRPRLMDDDPTPRIGSDGRRVDAAGDAAAPAANNNADAPDDAS